MKNQGILNHSNIPKERKNEIHKKEKDGSNESEGISSISLKIKKSYS